MADDYRDIPSLLHDAELVALEWEPLLAFLKLHFSCLRRSEDGSTIENPIVELSLEGIAAIAAYYDPPNEEVKPSEFSIGSTAITESDLQEWSNESCRVSLAINSIRADFELATACITDWLIGDAEKAEQSPLRIHLQFEGYSYAKESVRSSLFFACDSIEPFAGGVPISVNEWRTQFEAWWKGWQEHWSQKDSETSDSEPVIEDTLIPAGEAKSVDLFYRPPTESGFQLEPTDAPPELLRPIEDFHVGLLEQNWLKMAVAYPELDQSVEARADQLKGQSLSFDFGRWIYVRQIDSWWREEGRACVIVRGIEHRMPDEDDPASNAETVMTYGLRKFQDRWIIWTWSQGWPQFGSAPLI